jgi:hypothetical protein
MKFSCGICLSFVVSILFVACDSGSNGARTNLSYSTERSQPYFAPRTDKPIGTIRLGDQTASIYPHPRIWITKDVLQDLKSRATDSNPMWVGLRNSVNAALASGGYKTDANAATLLNFAIAYRVTGRPELFAAAKKVLFNFTNSSLYSIACDGTSYCGNDNIDYGSIHLMYISAAYDWLIDDLSPTERKTMQDWVYNRLLPFLHKHPYGDLALHNLGHTKWCGEFLWALATLKEDPRAESLLQSKFSFWKDEILPTLDETLPGGHTYSGSGYGYNRVFKYQLYGFEAAYSALGMNMYADHPWPVDELQYRIHASLPLDGMFFSDWESAEGVFNEGRMTENEAILAHRYQRSWEGRIGQFYVEKDFLSRDRISPSYIGLWFLWYDPTLPQEDYRDVLPTAYVADGMGLWMSRSAWHKENSAWIGLSAAPYIGDHQLQNSGSFKIFKKEHLVVENGNFYAGQSQSATPFDTNILFIGDGKVDFGDVTGGLKRRGDNAFARIDRFFTDDQAGISYARANLAEVYSPTYFPVDTFYRSVVHFKEDPESGFDFFVLHDRVRTDNPESKKEFFYLAEPPGVSGNVATMLSTHRRSKLYVHNLMPETTAFQVDSVTDKTSRGYGQESDDQITRLTLRSTQGPARGNTFLTVFAATGDVNAAKQNVTTVKSSDSAWIGAVVQSGTKSRVALFPASKEADTSRIEWTAPNGKAQFSVFELEPEASYSFSTTLVSGKKRITLQRANGGALRVNEQGVLLFTS